MGYGFILEIQKPRVAPAWLLAVCVMLCLMPGAEAITCEHCIIMNPDIDKRCLPALTCTLPDGYCLAVLTYYDHPGGALKRVDKRCVPKNAKECGTERMNKKEKVRHDFVCCDENDICMMPRRPA